MNCILCGKSRSIFLLLVLLLGAYFTNVEVQSYFGRQALEETGLVSFEFDEALLKAEVENKLVLVDVSAIWCSTCRKLDQAVFADANVKSVIKKNYIFSRIEYESEDGQMFLKRFDAAGFPTLFVIHPDGSVVRRLRVTFSPNEFISQL